MLVSLFRIIKYGIQSFLRNGWLSMSTISIMILTLIVFEGLVLFNFVAKAAIGSIEEKVDISVYFKSNVPEDSILSVKRSLESLEEVKSVEYVTKEKALEEFKAKHAKDETILKTLEELDENPLLPSLNVKAEDISQYTTIASYLDTPSLKDLVDKVTYAQNKVVIDRLSSILRTTNQAIILLTVFLTFLAIMAAFNTIRLAIFSSSEQISIMRLVGASNSFIRGPFIVEGVIYGLIAAGVSFIVMLPVVLLVSPHIENFVSGVNLTRYVGSHWLRLTLNQIVFGLALSIVSSIIAVRRYLKT